MIRHLIPHIDCGRWGGAALTDDGTMRGDDVQGFCLVIQWLGLLIEIGGGRVRSGR